MSNEEHKELLAMSPDAQDARRRELLATAVERTLAADAAKARCDEIDRDLRAARAAASAAEKAADAATLSLWAAIPTGTDTVVSDGVAYVRDRGVRPRVAYTLDTVAEERTVILKEVQVVAPVGTVFGTVRGENGVLTIVCRPPGVTEWPHGVVPDGGLNTIQPGYTRYCVTDDETPEEATCLPAS